MTDAQLDQLARWYHSEYQRRTEAITDNIGKIEWLVPEYRVSRTEVTAYAQSIGIELDADDTIQLFHYLNQGKANA